MRLNAITATHWNTKEMTGMRKIYRKFEVFIEVDADCDWDMSTIHEQISTLLAPRVSTRDCREHISRSHVRLTKSVMPPKAWQ